MARLKKRERRLVIITLVVACGLFVYSSLIEPRMTRWSHLSEKIGTVEKNLADTQNLLNHRKEIEANSSALQKQIAAQGNNDQELKSMLVELERLSRGAEMNPVSMRPQKSRDLGLYQLMSVELSIEGDQRNLVRFLYDLGNSAQLLRLDRVRVNALRSAEKVRAEFLVIKILSTGGHR